MNYYDVLEVPKNADAATLKKAYRRKSKECHPDRKGGDARAMVWINKAYETLSDPEKRAYYDACGEDKPLTTVEQMARSILIEAALQAAVNSDTKVNFVRVAANVLNTMSAKLESETRPVKLTKERLETHLLGLSCEADEENDIARAFVDQLQKAATQMEAMNNRKLALEMATKRLKKYKSSVIESFAPYPYANMRMTSPW